MKIDKDEECKDVDSGKSKATLQERARLLDALEEHDWYSRRYKGLAFMMTAACVSLIVLFILDILPEGRGIPKGFMVLCGGVGILDYVAILYAKRKIVKYRGIARKLLELDGIADGKSIIIENGEVKWKRMAD